MYPFFADPIGSGCIMEQNETRRRVNLMISVPIAIVLGLLFFMPWLSISFEPKGLVEMGTIPEGVTLPPELKDTMEVARVSGKELTEGAVTVSEKAKEVGTTLSSETHMPSRTWVYAGLALPGLILLVCALALGDKISLVGAGKMMLLLAFAGVIVMYSISRINYVDDMVDKVLEMYDENASAGMPAGLRAEMERNMAQRTESLKKVYLTAPTGMLWLTMGAYAAACVCGLTAIRPARFSHARLQAIASPGALPVAAQPPHRSQRRPASNGTGPVHPVGERQVEDVSRG